MAKFSYLCNKDNDSVYMKSVHSNLTVGTCLLCVTKRQISSHDNISGNFNSRPHLQLHPAVWTDSCSLLHICISLCKPF